MEDATLDRDKREGLTPDETKALDILNRSIPPKIRAELGYFVRAFGVNFNDGRTLLLVHLERGYFLHITNPPALQAEGRISETSLFLSPEVYFAFGILYALFTSGQDETAFWDKLTPEDAAKMRGVIEFLAENGGQDIDPADIGNLRKWGQSGETVGDETADGADMILREEEAGDIPMDNREYVEDCRRRGVKTKIRSDEPPLGEGRE